MWTIEVTLTSISWYIQTRAWIFKGRNIHANTHISDLLIEYETFLVCLDSKHIFSTVDNLLFTAQGLLPLLFAIDGFNIYERVCFIWPVHIWTPFP